MDLKDAIRDVAKRSRVARDTAITEEATKNGVILPLIRALGFDVFDISQVVPEYVSDVGTKKGEKVDYALKIDGKVAMLVEAKPISMNLGDAQYSQLYRYFGVSDAQIAILTNGAQVWFFSDVDEKNKMDKRPFFKFDLEGYDDDDIKELEKFHKDSFSVSNILETASLLKYSSSAAVFINGQFSNPDDDLVKLIARQIYEGNVTKSVIEQLRQPIKAAFSKVIRDRIQQRLNVALDDPEITEAEKEPQPSAPTSEIETTAEEWQAFYIVQAIASEVTSPETVFIRDAKSYCSIIFADNNRKPICRLYFNSKSVKYLGLYGESKDEVKTEISSPLDIYKYREDIKSSIKRYL